MIRVLTNISLYYEYWLSVVAEFRLLNSSAVNKQNIQIALSCGTSDK